MRTIATFLGAFGLGTLTFFSGIPFLWVLAGIVAGVFARGRLTFAALGFIAAIAAWALLDDKLAPGPAYEGPDYGILFGPPIIGLATAAGMWVGTKLLPPLPGQPASRPGNVGFGAVAIAAGIVAILVASISWAVELQVPSRRSFEFALPAGWTVLAFQPFDSYWDPTYGNHWTAVRGGTSKPQGTEPPTHPVLGVTVIRAPYDPQECIRSIHGWSTGSVPVYELPMVDEGPTDLPVGPAYRVVRKAGDGSLDLFGWGITRSRRVGAIQEDLCYMLVLTSPANAGIGREQADEIAAGFSFR